MVTCILQVRGWDHVLSDPDWNGNKATLHWAGRYDLHQDVGSYFHVEAEPKDLPASSDDWKVRRETSLPHGRYKWKQGSRRDRETLINAHLCC